MQTAQTTTQPMPSRYNHNLLGWVWQVTWLASPRSEAQAHVCWPICDTPWWVLLEHYYVATIFQRRVWHRALSVYYACIQSSGIILVPQATFVPNFISFAASIAELAHGEKSSTQSLNHSPSLFDAPGTEVKKRKGKEKEVYLYSAILSSLSKCSDMDHTVLPANYTISAFPS